MEKTTYVNLAQALKLKSFGYPQNFANGDAVYCTTGSCAGTIAIFNSSYPERDKKSIAAPTIYQAINWLREELNVEIFATRISHEDEYSSNKLSYKTTIRIWESEFKYNESNFYMNDTYEDALKMGINDWLYSI